MLRKRPFGRAGQGLLVASTICTVASNTGFASALEQKPYVSMNMYQPVSSQNGGSWQFNDFGNVNMYDIGGLLRFLYTEVLPEEGNEPGRTSRGHGVDEVAVWRLKVLNPPAAVSVEHQWEFAPYAQFKDGAIVDTAALTRLADFGDQVGIQASRPGSADPRFAWDGVYYEFSVSGPCPNLKDDDRGFMGMYIGDPRCFRYKDSEDVIKGTRCEGVPDGSKGCSVVIESTEVVSLDRLVGILQQDCGGRKCTSWQDFHSNCADTSLQFTLNGRRYCREYSVHPDCSSACESDKIDCKAFGDSGLEFWRGRCDASRNFERSEAIVAHQPDGLKQQLRQYASSPSCSKHVGCSSPNSQEGLGYCHRDMSGVCDTCIVPGTITTGSLSLGQPRCRLDLFTGSLLEYQQQLPTCSTACGGRCSLATDAEACCVYLGACTHDWEVGLWSSCSSSCSDGSRTRKVWCPFAEEVGPCDASTKPREIETCQGDRCPWEEDSGDWEPCDNPCGLGTHSKRLRCPQGADQCAGTTKPRPASRECYGMSSRHKYCRQCSADETTCSQCSDGFTFYNGHCVNRHSFGELIFHVNTAAGRLLDRSDIFASVGLAMAIALSNTGIAANAVSMSIVEDESTSSGNAIVTMAVTALHGRSLDDEDYEETLSDTADALSRLEKEFQEVDLEGLRKRVTGEMHRHFSRGLAAILGIDLVSTLRRFCPKLREWRADTSSCAEPPQFLLAQTTMSPSDADGDGGSHASGDSESADQQHSAQAFAHEGIQEQTAASAVDETHSGRADALKQEQTKESSSALGDESGKEHNWKAWAIAGASLGGAVATGLTIIVAVARRKKGLQTLPGWKKQQTALSSSNEADAFAKLARG